MAVSAHAFGAFAFGQFSGEDNRRVDWINDTIKVMLMKAAYAPDQDTQGFLIDIQANEIVTPGYVEGGKELAEKTEQYDAATNTVRLKAKTVLWKEVSLEARYAVVYKLGEEVSSSPLMGYIDFGEVKKAASGIFRIEWDPTDGVLRGIVE